MKQSSQWPRPSAPFSPAARTGGPKTRQVMGRHCVNIAAAGGGVERGAGGVVGEVFEAGLIGFGCAERAGLGIAGEAGAMLGEPGAGAALDFGSERGV